MSYLCTRKQVAAALKGCNNITIIINKVKRKKKAYEKNRSNYQEDEV